MYCLPGLVKLARIAILPHWPSSLVNLYQVAVISILYYNNISPVAAIAAIAAGALVCAFVKEAIPVGNFIIVRIKEEVIVILRATISIAIIIIL